MKHFESFSRSMISDNLFLASCIILIAVTVVSVAAKIIYNYYANKLLLKIVGDNQKKVFDQLIVADYAFFVKNQQGKLIYTAVTSTEKANAAIVSVNTLLYGMINVAVLFSLLTLLSWQGTLLIILIGLLYAALIRVVIARIIQKCAQVYLKESEKRNVILNEFISGIKAIKAYWAFDSWKSKHGQTVEKALAHRLQMRMGKIFPENLMRFLFYILIASAGIFLSYQANSEIVAYLPLLGTFAIVVNRILPSTHIIGNSLMGIGECIPDIRAVHELCTRTFDPKPEGRKALVSFTDRIVFEGVSFKYDAMTDDLLKNISFSVERKKMTALVGVSGSGKTTIINLLLKLYRPDSGRITIDGKDIFEFTNRSYLAKIGYVSQETFIFNSSIRENISFGMASCTDEMIIEAAKLANAHEFIINTHQGYETIVGDSGVKLSGGQRQRLAIARAMLHRPDIIIFDEATSSLDNISEKKIQAAINNISKHTTVLVIAHRLSTVESADKIIILERGQVKEQGTHEELLRNKSSYYDLYVSHDATSEEVNELIEG